MPASRLWLVRHAQPLIAPGVCYGRLDVAADVHATHAASQRLAAALPARIAAVRHSPLQRCVQFASALQALRPELTSTTEPRIAELDFGSWEGQPWSALPRADIDHWTAAFHHYHPGGGESLAQMLERVALALHTARALACTGDVVWLTHAGVARCAEWLLEHGTQRLPQAHEWPQDAPAFGAWTAVPLQPE